MNLNLETLFNVKNKTAVVTGGSRGIGAMITEGFLANGCKVYITARKKEALEDKAKELTKKYNIDCIPYCFYLSTVDGVNDFAKYIKDN